MSEPSSRPPSPTAATAETADAATASPGDPGRRAAPRRFLVGKGTSIVVIGSVALGNASTYGFQLVTGRFLGADAYGLLAGLMTVVAVIGVSASSLGTVAAKAVSAGEVEPRPAVMDRLTRSSVVVGAALTVALVVASPWLSEFLKVDNVIPMLFVAASIVPTCLGAIAVGRLQGQMRFIAMSLLSATFAVAKLGVGFATMAAGLGVTALVAGLVVSTSVCAAGGLYLARHAGAITTKVLDRSTAQVFLGVTLFWVLVSFDVPFARANFTESMAGQYAAADVIGRAVLWLPAVITQITFPQVTAAVSNIESTEPLMLRAFAFAAGLAAAGVAFIWLFGEPVFRVLYGSEYPEAHRYAWKIGLATVPFAIVHLLLHHNFARNHSRFVSVLIGASIAQMLALTFGPHTPTAYATVLGIVASGTAVALLPRGGWRFLSGLIKPGHRARFVTGDE
ncbi:MAG: oligosaccharide flippase family protein [Microthrixaceae bacterium]